MAATAPYASVVEPDEQEVPSQGDFASSAASEGWRPCASCRSRACCVVGGALLLLATVSSVGLAGIQRLVPFAQPHTFSDREALLVESTELRQRIRDLQRKVDKMVDDITPHQTESALGGASERPTGGFGQPAMYGKVGEKTIWAYWYDEDLCPTSAHCTLPAHLQLCIQTVLKNRGGFEYRIVHDDEVDQYVTPNELPPRWRELQPAQEKDALMNALLARYGGVSLDISIILLRPLDEYWDAMVSQGASFRGYMYRHNGQAWRHHEVMAVWFLMARKASSVFATVVRDQAVEMDRDKKYDAYGDWYLAFGDQTLLPVLSMYNYSLPKCFDDQTVPESEKCPEFKPPCWYKGELGPPLNDARFLLEDPRDGPQLPMAWLGMEQWSVKDNTDRSGQSDWSDQDVGAPMHGAKCKSMKQCWEIEFLPRFSAHRLNFVKFFGHAEILAKKTKSELLADKDSYFYNWLLLAGLPLELMSA